MIKLRYLRDLVREVNYNSLRLVLSILFMGIGILLFNYGDLNRNITWASIFFGTSFVLFLDFIFVYLENKNLRKKELIKLGNEISNLLLILYKTRNEIYESKVIELIYFLDSKTENGLEELDLLERVIYFHKNFNRNHIKVLEAILNRLFANTIIIRGHMIKNIQKVHQKIVRMIYEINKNSVEELKSIKLLKKELFLLRYLFEVYSEKRDINIVNYILNNYLKLAYDLVGYESYVNPKYYFKVYRGKKKELVKWFHFVNFIKGIKIVINSLNALAQQNKDKEIKKKVYKIITKLEDYHKKAMSKHILQTKEIGIPKEGFYEKY